MKTSTLIDTNVLIDVWGKPVQSTAWSIAALIQCKGDGALVVNPLVWSEIAPLDAPQDVLEAYCDELGIEREALPWDGSFRAGLAQAQYRRAGGERERTLPDFLIGAHALVAGHRLLTRDPGRYRSYFPDLVIIAPDAHPPEKSA